LKKKELKKNGWGWSGVSPFITFAELHVMKFTYERGRRIRQKRIGVDRLGYRKADFHSRRFESEKKKKTAKMGPTKANLENTGRNDRRVTRGRKTKNQG